jgi:amino acid permease
MKKLSMVVLIVLAIVLVVVAYIYLSKAAGSLPHFFPGYSKGSVHKHTKHAVACIVLAVVCLVGAWMTSGSSKTASYQAD